MNTTGQEFGKKTGKGGAFEAPADFNPYAEDPRPNLFNIVKNIRENKVAHYY